MLQALKERLFRSTPDGPYAAQTFEQLARLRRWSREDVILDVGANDGRTILRWRRHLPAPARVIAFEPVRETYVRSSRARRRSRACAA